MDSNAISNPDWAALPKHLLDMVLEKLVPFSADCARFSSVCHEWHCVDIEYRKQLQKRVDLQVPLLLFPKTETDVGEVKNLYNVTTKELVNLEVRVPWSTRYAGSSRGWLITIDDFFVTLINPFAPPEEVIRLPPLLADNVDIDLYIRKAILSADPTKEPNNYIVAAIYGDDHQLAFINPGREDASWIYTDKIQTLFDDIIYYKGRFHTTGDNGKTYCFDDKLFVPQELSSTPRKSLLDKSYIVESVDGDLLVVYRYFSSYEDRVTKNFEIFKWDPSGPIWAEMKSLGGETLFLGDSMSTSVLASVFPGCSPNSIYFTHDFDFSMVFGICGHTDSGVFNIENSSFTPHYRRNKVPYYSNQPPIWFVPNFIRA